MRQLKIKKMKKIISIIILFATISVANSCKDAYEIIQDGEFSESATFQTVNDMQKFLNNTYDRVDVSNEIGISSVFTDELGIGSQNGGRMYHYITLLLLQETDLLQVCG